MNHRTITAMLFLLALGACTANVENPTVNQTGRTGDTECFTSCDDADVKCKAQCNDEGCKASCKASYDDCSVKCAPEDDAGAN